MTAHIKFDLRGFRRREDMTQQQVAERLGITQSAVSHFERNPFSVTIETINAVSDKLGIDAAELICLEADI